MILDKTVDKKFYFNRVDTFDIYSTLHLIHPFRFSGSLIPNGVA